MKNWEFLLLLLLLFGSCETRHKSSAKNESSQEEILREAINYNLLKNKTILDSTVNNLFFQFFFVEKDTSSRFYTLLRNFDIHCSNCSDSYQEYLDSLVHHFPMAKNNQYRGNWIEIHKFEENYFSYIPANRSTIGKTIISDSTVTDFMMDGKYPNLITNANSSKGITTLELHSPAHVFINADHKEQRVIESIQQENAMIKISTFIDHELESTKYYIPESQVYDYPIIVNYTDNPTKIKEFKFDKM